VRVWEFVVGKTLLELRQQDAPIKQATFSPDGRQVALVDEQGYANIYSCEFCAASGKELLGLAESLRTRNLTAGERIRFLALR
jgi:hypothetical protein